MQIDSALLHPRSTLHTTVQLQYYFKSASVAVAPVRCLSLISMLPHRKQSGATHERSAV